MKTLVFCILLAALCFIAGCGGNNNEPPTDPTPTPVVTDTPLPTPPPINETNF